MRTINIKTHTRVELIDITDEVQAQITKSRVSEGICVIFCPHTTAGLTINENADPSVKSDIIRTLSALIPKNGEYAHAEGNSDSHIKSSLFGPSVTVMVHEARAALGTWQGIFFCESDGPRARQIWVKAIKE